MAPIKALCSERNEAWSHKFNTVGLNCQEMTGDSDIDEFWQIQKADIILTTPVSTSVLPELKCFPVLLPSYSFVKYNFMLYMGL